LDLHGNKRKKEKAPDGSADVNVFDINQGVAIALFAKFGRASVGEAGVFHSERWGDRDSKYHWLEKAEAKTTKWTKLEPKPPLYLFKPEDSELKAQYERFYPIPSLLSQNGDPAPGVVTTQDDFAISWSAEEAAQKVETLLHTDTEEEARLCFRLCTQAQWNYKRAKEELADGSWRKRITPILYRPFDTRWTVYDRNVAVHRRERVSRHLIGGDNLALVVPKQHKGDFGALVAQTIVAHKAVAGFDINYCFPLWLLPTELFATQSPSAQRQSNLAPSVFGSFARVLKKKDLSPENLLSYVYAVVYAPSYRRKYAEFLKTDFPRVPFTSDAKLFAKVAVLGQRLADLHLLRSMELDPPMAKFHGDGDNKVATGKTGLRYEDAKKRVWINASQHFAPVPPEVWAYHVGGYQVAEKWLKDRRGRHLTLDEVRTYCRIVTALHHTICIQREIDALYPEVEATLLDFTLTEGS